MSGYVEIEPALVAALNAKFPAARVATETPSNLADVLPCIVVSRFGGVEDSVWTFDNANVDFDIYDATRADARTLAYAVRTWVRSELPGSTLTDPTGASGYVGRTQTVSGPVWTPYDNTNVRRFVYGAGIRIHSL